MEPFAARRRDRWDLTLSITILFSMQSKIKNIPIITKIKRLDKSENRLKPSGRKQTTLIMEASGGERGVCACGVVCVCVCVCVYMNVESHSLSMFTLMYEDEHPPLVSTFTLVFTQCVFVWATYG